MDIPVLKDGGLNIREEYINLFGAGQGVFSAVESGKIADRLLLPIIPRATTAFHAGTDGKQEFNAASSQIV